MPCSSGLLGEATGVGEKGKASVNRKMTRTSNLVYLDVYNTNVCLKLFQSKKVQMFALMKCAVSVALAAQDAC